MPRQSSADLAVVRPATDLTRLRPPAELGKDEQAVWRQIVLSVDEKHFRPSDAPLLVRYCQNVVLASRAAAALDREGAVIGSRPNPWLTVAEKADRALVALSMRLRVSPQARLRADGMAVKGPPASVYELMRLSDAEDEA
jgi:P27 family predicted phage terminase small subunit